MSLADHLQQLWSSAPADSPPELTHILDHPFMGDCREILAALRWDQQQRWRTSQPIRVEEYVSRLPLPAGIDWEFELAVGESDARRDTQRPLDEDEIKARFPQLSEMQRNRLFQLHEHSLTQSSDVPPITRILEPSLVSASYVTGCGTVVGEKGRYRLDRVLGEGSHGCVYLGYDEQLLRQVAIKVPNRERFQKASDVEDYLAEAQTVAALEHPSIVPIYTVERTDDGSIFIVSRYLDGGTLREQMNGTPWDPRKAAELLIPIARGLDFAHQMRLIHRDVKPANILLEARTGCPFIADFGLAVREDEYLRQVSVAGTPAYMSPEQARGEGHRLDGRSDVFSLGVILYELLTGQRPFRGRSIQDIIREVTSSEPRAPRRVQELIPSEIERICLKALSKRVSDRHISAAAFAEDLEEWLKPKSVPSTSAEALVPVVPKGLRSFDVDDANFFLDLLPGPRNRDGLPESIAFWKQRIEETDPDKTFNVGLIYGPSGCGKSSLVKAGLLPHLASDVIAVYVESTPEETGLRILRGIHKRLPELKNSASLVETLTSIRLGQFGKVVILIDQFEQWLHGHRSDSNAGLIQALRQCDGGRLQAVLMIRDDFAMAASRLMRALETRIVEGYNFATVDLFDEDHSRKVLTRFGQAFGKLPARIEKLSRHEKDFVGSVTSGMADDGKVVPVRLALFAEMVKGKPWMPETLHEVGGTAGIGVNFLEETFHGRNTNPDYRLHARAARAVLKSLLPELGTDIKGHMRSQQELLEASGYGHRSADFRDLLRILDSELRLITPTDPEGSALGDSACNTSLTSRYYQLTHDYLVPSLREWMTRKQRETLGGRAELKLEERAAIWGAKRENRQLPTVAEWLSIRILTDSKRWTEPQRTMMRKAASVYASSFSGVLLVLLMVGVGMQRWMSAERWKNLQEQSRVAAESLQNNLGPAIPVNIKELRRLPDTLVLAELQSRFASATNERHKLSLSFALANYGMLDAPYLISRIDDITEADTENYVAAMQSNPKSALVALKGEASLCGEKSLWPRRAKLAIVALGLGDAELAHDVCSMTRCPDPEQRTLFIAEFPRWELNPETVLQAVMNSDSPSLRSGICLAVGQCPAESFNDSDRSSWQTLASNWFVDKGDSATHSAAGWLLRHWNLPLPDVSVQHEIAHERDWYMVRSTGASMVRIRPNVSFAGSLMLHPLEKYRQQLAEMTAVDLAQKQSSEFLLQHATACFHQGQFEETLRDLDQLDAIEAVPNDPADGSFPWTVRFYKWPNSGPNQPPADWAAVVNSTPVSERTVHLLDLRSYDRETFPGLNENHFAVLATAEPVLAAGTYEIRATYDDGIRVYVDDQLLIDRWTANHPTSETSRFTVSEGRHTIRVEYFQIAGGAALAVDLFLENSPRLQPGFSVRQAKVLEYRTLALARLGRAADAIQSLSAYVNLEIPTYRRTYVEAQVAAWLGNSSEASERLTTAAQLLSGEASDAFYTLAGAAALCSQAAIVSDVSRSEAFADQSIQWLQRAVDLGYSDLAGVCGDPDFVMLHGDPRFAKILNEIQSKTIPVVADEFWMCDREVTRGQFEQFMNDSSYPVTEKPVDWNGVETIYSPTADHPAQQISWYDAIMYCNWLSRKEGLPATYERTGTGVVEDKKDEIGENDATWRLVPEATGYRLLTEAEWEYACRAGTTTEFSSGDDPALLASYCQMYPSRLAATCGEKLPNAWGLHDMHGNVHEWCWNKYDAKRKSRVLRGGSFFKLPGSLHSAYRLSKRPDYRYSNTGFRIARSAETVSSEAQTGAENNLRPLRLNAAMDMNGTLAE